MIGQGQWATAFLLFVAAGVSDAVDGFIARRFDMRSEFGAYLDAVADKALLVSIYVTPGVVGVLPGWLAIVVVSRDIMIVGAIIMSWLMGRPVAIKPLTISKLNTAAQIAFAALVPVRDGLRLRARAVRSRRHVGRRRLDRRFGGCLSRRMAAPHGGLKRRADRAAMVTQRQVGVLARRARPRRRSRSTSCATSCCRSWPGSRSPICSTRVADRFERLGIGRLGATLLILVLFVLVVRARARAAGAAAVSPAGRLRRPAAGICRPPAGARRRAGRAAARAARRP